MNLRPFTSTERSADADVPLREEARGTTVFPAIVLQPAPVVLAVVLAVFPAIVLQPAPVVLAVVLAVFPAIVLQPAPVVLVDRVVVDRVERPARRVELTTRAIVRILIPIVNGPDANGEGLCVPRR
jgi:hypothetical protein